MPRRSIAPARLLVRGGAVLFGACVLMQQAQAEHSGGGGGIPVRNPSDRAYALPQPRYNPSHLRPHAPVPRYSVATPAKDRLAHTAAVSHLWTPVSRTQPAEQPVRSAVVGPTPLHLAARMGWNLVSNVAVLLSEQTDCPTRHGDREENRDARKVF